MIAPNTVTLSDAADGILLRQDKLLDTGLKAKYLVILKDIYKETNMKSIKNSVRMVVPVHKGTNAVKLQPGNYMFSSASAMHNGKLTPLFINSNLIGDVIDLSGNKKCQNDCGCELCGNASNYELIQVQVMAEMPNGDLQEFTKTSRKKVNKDGSYVLEVTEPIAVFEENIHVATELQTREEFICSLEVDEKGCVLDTKTNRKKFYASCNFDCFENECGRPINPSDCLVKPNEINISESGDTIFLPSNLCYDNLVVRVYVDLPTKDLRIPFVCKNYFMWRAYYESIMMNDKVQQYVKKDAETKMNKSETEMVIDLSRLTLSEQFAVIAPKKRMK